MQQLLLSLNPILSGAALESIHLMNNGKFNPGLACSTWLWFTREEKDKYYSNKSNEYSVSLSY